MPKNCTHCRFTNKLVARVTFTVTYTAFAARQQQPAVSHKQGSQEMEFRRVLIILSLVRFTLTCCNATRDHSAHCVKVSSRWPLFSLRKSGCKFRWESWI